MESTDNAKGEEAKNGGQAQAKPYLHVTKNSQNKQFLNTDQNFANNNQLKKSVYFTDDVKIRIENVRLLN